MRRIHVITHPQVAMDPAVPIDDWELSATGRERVPKLYGALDQVRSVWSSRLPKALTVAELIAAELGTPVITHPGLGEIDRSATGYLSEPQFWENYQRFLDQPDASARGWETAHDAQRRVQRAVEAILADPRGAAGDLALVTHGGAAALLMCQLNGTPVQRLLDQPSPGSHFSFDAEQGSILTGWQTYESVTEA
jgi:broad specificity phosphatase PhoE